jgi:hypothetical protein
LPGLLLLLSFEMQPVLDWRSWLVASVQVVYISSMKSPKDIPSLSREELLVLVAEQQRQISKLQGQPVKAVERLTREKQRQSEHTAACRRISPLGGLRQQRAASPATAARSRTRETTQRDADDRP